jgi:hypothetical protein
MFKRSLFLMFLLSVSLNSFAGEVDVKKLHKAKWIEVTSENFLVITDAKEKKAQAMARELEQFRHFLALMLGYKQRVLQQKVAVILAKNKFTFAALGLPKEYAGIFVQSSQPMIFANSKGFSSSSDGHASMGRQVVLHELTHLLMNNISINLANPPWYSEGTAEYFGTYTEKRGMAILGEMKLLQERWYSMTKPGPGIEIESVNTETLFKTGDIGIKVNMNKILQSNIERFYARSLAVVHYLNADPERRKMMYQYLYLINKGHSVDDAFKAVFKMTFAEFDKDIDEYINGDFLYARTFEGIKYPEFTFSSRALEQRQALDFLVSYLASVGAPLMEDSHITTMYQEAKKLYPNFIAGNNSSKPAE